MEEISWTNEQMQMAQQIVEQRTKANRVVDFIPERMIESSLRQTPWNRFDYETRKVVDGENLTLYEKSSRVCLTRAQVDESDLHKAMTTFDRAASSYARLCDSLCLVGWKKTQKNMPPGVKVPEPVPNIPPSLRERAVGPPITVGTDSPGENFVQAIYQAVLTLEGRGYYSNYHVVLGDGLWAASNDPSVALVTPRERTEHTLAGGGFYRSTTLPPEEALVVSLDGYTVEYVMAGGASDQPRIEFLDTETDDHDNQNYIFRLYGVGACIVREREAILPMKLVKPGKA